jgi:hypothetical protein
MFMIRIFKLKPNKKGGISQMNLSFNKLLIMAIGVIIGLIIYDKFIKGMIA